MSSIILPFSPQEKMPSLAEETIAAKKAWQQALEELNYAHRDYVDYVIFNISAAEKRFTILLKEARRQGITAWAPCRDGKYTGPPVPENRDNGRSG